VVLEPAAIESFRKLFDIFQPVHAVWWAVFGQSISWGLSGIHGWVAGVPFLAAIGAYGLAIILLTIVIKLVLSPLFQLQLSLSRRAANQQRALAPELAQLKKKYKGDPQRQQQEMMKLYREHGVNPLSSLSGCFPALLQFPILTALYYVFLGNAQHNRFADHFLFVPHLNQTPAAHSLVHGLPIPAPAYLVIPLLAAATTFVQSKMMQQPVSPIATEQEQQAQAMQRNMQLMMPLMILYFAFITPAGLGLYWFVSNCFAIIQQYLVTGWGGLRPARLEPAAVPAAATGRDRGRNGVPQADGRSPRRGRVTTPMAAPGPQPRSTRKNRK
jgi:YidC/Oxa1 family membrane protein insertase